MVVIATMISSHMPNAKPHNYKEFVPSITENQKSHPIDRVDCTHATYGHTEHVTEVKDHPNQTKAENPMQQNTEGDSSGEESVNNKDDPNSSLHPCSCKMWTCAECKKQFTSARALKIHEVKQHENVPRRYLKCTHCDEVFEHGNLLQIHMKVHHNIKVRCPQCKDMFDHPRVLSMHLKAHHAEPVCLVCGVKFDHDKILKLHMEHYHKVNRKPTEQELSALQAEQDAEEEENGSDHYHHEGFTALPVRDEHCYLQANSNSIQEPPARSPDPERAMIINRSPLVNEVGSSTNPLSPDRRSFVGSPDHDDRDHSPRMLHIEQRPIAYPNEHVPGHWPVFRPVHNYREPYHGQVLPPRGVMSPEQEHVMRAELRHYGHRPLGRSRSLPSNPALLQRALIPVYPWNAPGVQIRREFPREQRVDRAMLEAVRNSLRSKLQKVEATLLADDNNQREAASYLSRAPEHADSHDYYYPNKDVPPSYRPTVITTRSRFDDEAPILKRKPEDRSMDFEPPSKELAIVGREVVLGSPREEMPDPRMLARRRHSLDGVPIRLPEAATSTLTSLESVHNIPPRFENEFDVSDHSKIFIKRGAPRCNLCQQTFSSKMEYLHHLISHREKDGLPLATREELEFLEGVKRNMESMNEELHNSRIDEMHQNMVKSPPRDGEVTVYSTNQREDADSVREENLESTKSTPRLPSPPHPPHRMPVPRIMPFGTATCSECNDVFADSLSCRMHIEKRHMKPRCRDCGLEFDHKNLLKIHMDCYHSNMEVLQCYYCGESFKHRSEFLDHVTSHETENKGLDKAGENGSEQLETSGRRRWSQLVASAQLPMSTQGGFPVGLQRGGRLGAIGRGEKRKLTKTMSLPTRVPPQESEVSPCELPWKRRAKDDSTREIRTRIFMPSPGDKQPKAPLFPNTINTYGPPSELESAQFERNELAPFTQIRPDIRDGPTRSRLEADGQENAIHSPMVSPNDSRQDNFSVHREREANDATNRERMVVPLKRKLRRLGHQVLSRHDNFEKQTMLPAFDHQNALVKIEMVERESMSESAGHEPEKRRSEEKMSEGTVDTHMIDQVRNLTDAAARSKLGKHDMYSEKPLIGTIHNNLLKRLQQDHDSSNALPSRHLTVQHMLQEQPKLPCSPGTPEDSSPASSNPPSPAHERNQEAVSKIRRTQSNGKSESPQGEKRRDSITPMTKRALLHSLTLRRRSSAPDLRSNLSTSKVPNSTTTEVPIPQASVATSSPVDSPSSVDSAEDQPSSTSSQGLPRRKSREIVCQPCGLSFGHKKLYKIHVDAYHGEKQAHNCLQCGGKSFKDKNKFLRHLMEHQSAAKNTARPNDESKGELQQSNVLEQQPQRALFSADSSDPRPESDHVKETDSSPAKRSPGVSPSKSGHRRQHNLKVRKEGSEKRVKPQRHHKVYKHKANECFTCGKIFENGKQLEQHLSTHATINEDGQICCSLCNKAFDTHRKLEIHSRSHTGFKPHKCESCGRCFPYYSSYYYHKMTHTKDRPHKCPLCGKGFIQTRYLRAHLKTHKDEQGTSSAEVDNIIQNMKEDGPDSPALSENSTSTREDDEETATAEILCSFRRTKGLGYGQGISNGSQNSDADSNVESPELYIGSPSGSEENVFSSDDDNVAV